MAWISVPRLCAVAMLAWWPGFPAMGGSCASDARPPELSRPGDHPVDDVLFDAQTIRAADMPADAPAFADYPADAVYAGPVAAPDVSSDPRSRMFRTAISEGARGGPDFAGHFTLVSWGCGTDCNTWAIVDARDGRVFHPDALGAVDHANVAHEELAPPDGHLVKYRPDSRLLVVIGGVNEDPDARGISWFVWQDARLERIAFVHKPY